MTASLRLVYSEAAPPPSSEGVKLTSVDELEPHLRRVLDERFCGELWLRGHGTARICLGEGAIPWVRCDAYPEHLGDVLRRKVGLPDATLRRALSYCRNEGMRLGEGLLGLGLVRPDELRDCLYSHISDQLWEILAWPGPLVVEARQWPHRYDRAFTFDLDTLLRRPAAPTAQESARLALLLGSCRERLPGLTIACVVEDGEGTSLHALPVEDTAAQDLLGLCLVDLRQLLANRVTRDDGVPHSMVLTSADACIVVEGIDWHAGWLLVLAGATPPGRLLTVAQSAVRRAALAE